MSVVAFNVLPRALVQSLFERGFPLVLWHKEGDGKGPRDSGWPSKDYHPSMFVEGMQVGVKLGTEVAPGWFLSDDDIDWKDGTPIARKLLPPTNFIFGRAGKPEGHRFYLTPEPLISYRYEDPIDKTCLLEIRCRKVDGTVGLQTVVPPSKWWSKDGKQCESLAFQHDGGVSRVESAARHKHLNDLTAAGMLVARHLGHNGFGHDVRLAWAGYFLRAGVAEEDLILQGEGISTVCNNDEVSDVRRVVSSTAAALAQGTVKVKGGPALAKILGGAGKAIIDRINEWLGRDSDFKKHEGRIIAKNQHNIRRAIQLLGHELSYNEFKAQALFDGEPLTDSHWKQLYLEIDDKYRFQPPLDYYRMVVDTLPYEDSFHPVREYLDGLKWDETPRLHRWLIDAGAEDTDYVVAVSVIPLVAAVRRIRQPGCKYDEMLVLESKQGMDKSSVLRALCPDDEWFSDDLKLNADSKEIIEATLGKWIIEASDLSGKRKTQIEQLKAMLSRQVDGPARMAYGHYAVERPRHFIFIGTTNSSAYLTDSTGARRFWPVKVNRFDIEKIRRERDQLWAEAAHYEAQGMCIRLKESLWGEAAKEQERRREVDPWEETLRQAVIDEGTVGNNDGGRVRITLDALYRALNIPAAQRDRMSGLRISDIMHRFDFQRRTVRDAAKEPVPGFISLHPAPELTDEERPKTLRVEATKLRKLKMLGLGVEPRDEDPENVE